MLLICSASHGKNLELARLAAERASGQNMPCELLDLTENALPLYTSRADESPTHINALAEQFSRAKAFYFFTAEYNGSLPPVFTNAIAWLSTETSDFRALFNGKLAAIGTHSGGNGQKVLVALRLQLSHLGLNVIGREILTNKDKLARKESLDAVLAQLARLEPSLRSD